VVVAGGGLKCWGENTYGQLGNNAWIHSKVPVAVTGLSSGVVAVAAGYEHTCALTSAGAVKCWGRNDYGKLGNNSTTDSASPVNVTGLSSGVVAIGAGYTHTCALTSTGGVKCWGRNNVMGVLGNNSGGDSKVPVDVTGLSSGVVAISVGSNHTCALTSAGALKCWGANYFGNLGTGGWSNSKVPADVTGLSSGVASVSAGDTHTCALLSTGAVKCWGENMYGALGNNTLSNSPVPVDVTGLSSGVASVSAGGPFTCALTTAGAVKCWGTNGSGALGNNSPDSYSKVPVDVTGLSSGVVAVSAGATHACARTSAGIVKCWGQNGYGELGNNSTTSSKVPVDVVGL
jgi:alpha-tubulin suppressor-like RCC1 family protein